MLPVLNFKPYEAELFTSFSFPSVTILASPDFCPQGAATNRMKPIPLPSHVHYELLLQLLERKSLDIAEQQPALKEQVRQLIISLRKAFAQQKHLEDMCKQTGVDIEFRWSLNSVSVALNSVPEVLPPSETSQESGS
ncbi:MAG: hypothetical protein N5P05_003218 [Chroococcopsis gigantea SAG 12.99]|nr:hypothetical protein [Chroococcopsis gigantea SAG 12.99]